MKGRVIVFAPHPDDETLCCGGTIAKRISEGYEVYVVVMTDGRYSFLHVLGIDRNPAPEEVKEIRREEVKRATRILGVPEENLIFLNFVDRTLMDNEDEAVRRVVEVLSDKRPVEVYVPYKRDGHPDHRATYRIVKEAIRELGLPVKVYQYSITHKYARVGPIIDRLLSLFMKNIVCVDIKDFLRIKEEAVNQFKSELEVISIKQRTPLMDRESIRKYLKDEELFYVER